MYEEAISYLDDVRKDEKTLIVHHWDMDGSSSASIVSKILEETRGRGADFVKIPQGRKHQVGPRVEKIVRQEDVERLIVLDMSVEADRVTELREAYGVEILVIDHHDFDRVPDDAVFVNPRVEDDDAYIPASKLCNDIAMEFDLDLDWIAGLGIIQDFGAEQCMELFERLRGEYPSYFPEDELSQDSLVKGCRYGKYSSVMNIKPYKDTDRCALFAFNALTNARGLKYLESQEGYSRLFEYYREMNREFRRIKERFDDEKEVYDDEKMVFFTFESPFHINSSIATQISLEQEEWVYIIAKIEGDRVNVSSRCQSGRVDLGSVLRESLPENAGDGAEAGGHRKAAGASFATEAIDAFKENLLANL